MSFWGGRRVLVTGCSGFLGWWLTDELVRRGASVTGLVRDLTPTAPFFLEGLERKINTVRGSVEDFPLLSRAVAEYEIDTVFHLAAQAIVGVANRDPLGTFETNIRGTWTVLEACRRVGSVTRVIVASSDKAYGDQERLPYTEDLPLQGAHPYDVSKSCADLLSMAYAKSYGLPVSITRCGNLFGPGDLNFSRLIPGTIRSALLGERPVIRSDGTHVRDYVHVQDVAAAYLLLAERMDDPQAVGRAFNFSTGRPLSVLELTSHILRASGREDLTPVVLNQARNEIHRQYVSCEEARRVLGWSPGAPVEERLHSTIEWYRGYLAAEAPPASAGASKSENVSGAVSASRRPETADPSLLDEARRP